MKNKYIIYSNTEINPTSLEYNGKGLYVVQFETGIKIGISNRVRDRLMVYKSPWCSRIISVHFFSCHQNRDLEAHLKRKFKYLSVDNSNEFFQTSDTDLILNEIKSQKHYNSSKILYIKLKRRKIFQPTLDKKAKYIKPIKFKPPTTRQLNTLKFFSIEHTDRISRREAKQLIDLYAEKQVKQ